MTSLSVFCWSVIFFKRSLRILIFVLVTGIAYKWIMNLLILSYLILSHTGSTPGQIHRWQNLRTQPEYFPNLQRWLRPWTRPRTWPKIQQPVSVDVRVRVLELLTRKCRGPRCKDASLQGRSVPNPPTRWTDASHVQHTRLRTTEEMRTLHSG